MSSLRAQGITVARSDERQEAGRAAHAQFLEACPRAIANRVRTIILAIACFFPLLVSADSERAEKIVSYLKEKGKKADYTLVTPDIREEVVARLRKDAGGPKQEINGAGHYEYEILVHLGDVDTMKQIVETTRSRWLTGKGWAFHEVLAASVQPAVIPLIAEDFFRNDGDKITYGEKEDIWYTKRPFSIVMCRVAFSIVADSDAFAPEARKWARENLVRTDSSPPRLTREIVQKWWRENEGRFKVQDYRSVPPERLMPH